MHVPLVPVVPVYFYIHEKTYCESGAKPVGHTGTGTGSRQPSSTSVSAHRLGDLVYGAQGSAAARQIVCPATA